MHTATLLDFDTHHLTGDARKVADAIVAFLKGRLGQDPSGGGCRAFYDAKEWRERGERYGRNAVLVLVHDGGDLAPLCNWDYGDDQGREAFELYLSKLGFYVERCTSWYSGVYPL